MNADAIIERLEKLETWWADLGDDQDVLVVRKSDLDAAIADIRGLLADDFVSYADGIVTIGGTRYTKELLQAWGENGMPVGECFRIIRREDGVVGFERLAVTAALAAFLAYKAERGDESK